MYTFTHYVHFYRYLSYKTWQVKMYKGVYRYTVKKMEPL